MIASVATILIGTYAVFNPTQASSQDSHLDIKLTKVLVNNLDAINVLIATGGIILVDGSGGAFGYGVT